MDSWEAKRQRHGRWNLGNKTKEYSGKRTTCEVLIPTDLVGIGLNDGMEKTNYTEKLQGLERVFDLCLSDFSLLTLNT